MTKETLILYWLSEYQPDQWKVKYFRSAILYTVLKGFLTLYIKYDWNTINHECWVSMKEAEKMAIKCVGTVEDCLSYIRKKVG